MQSRLTYIYKLFGQSVLKANTAPNFIKQAFIRYKSSSTAGEIVSYLNTGNQLSSQSIFASLKNTYRTSQIAFDHEIQNTLTNGLKKYKKKDFQAAANDFEEIIKSLSGDRISDLSDNQKEILSKAFFYSAKILSLGTTNEAKLSVDYLEQAIKLTPGDAKVISMRNSIIAEKLAYKP